LVPTFAAPRQPYERPEGHLTALIKSLGGPSRSRTVELPVCSK